MSEFSQNQLTPEIEGLRQKNCLPDGSCDCQVQLFNSSQNSEIGIKLSADFENWTLLNYLETQKYFGTERAVLVHPPQHGDDLTWLIQNISDFQKSAGASKQRDAKGVALIEEDVRDEELEYWGSCGVIGAQFCMVPGMESLDWGVVERLAWRIHDFGWNVELTMEGADLHEVEQRLSSWPNRIVINQIGRFLRTKSLNQRGFKSLTRLIDRDKAWVKLSAPYESSSRRRFDDPDVSRIAQALVEWAPERMVWGSNWPFHNKLNCPPSDATLLDILTYWVPEESRRDRILAVNPCELYGFDEFPKDEITNSKIL